MEKVSVNIKTLKIEIRTLVLDGKRFTKSVFLQLPNINPLVARDNSGLVTVCLRDGVQYLGFVYLPSEHTDYKYSLIFTKDGLLYKCKSNLPNNNWDWFKKLYLWANPYTDKSNLDTHKVQEFAIELGKQVRVMEDDFLNDRNQLFISI